MAASAASHITYVPMAIGFLYLAVVVDASVAFGKRCREAGLRPSMGSVGDAYDVVMAESFFSTLEPRLLSRRRFASQAEARIACSSYIEGWHNRVRLHSALGYRSPIAYETTMQEAKTDT